MRAKLTANPNDLPEPDDPNQARVLLEQIGLGIMAQELENVSAESISKKWNFNQTLSELISREISVRHQRKIVRLLRTHNYRKEKRSPRWTKAGSV